MLKPPVVQLIGATTENPSFKLTGALLSRMRVFVLRRLEEDDVMKVLKKAVARVVADGQSQADSIPVLSSSQTSSSSQDPFAASEPSSSQPAPEPSSSQTLSPTQDNFSASSQAQQDSDTDQDSVPFHSSYPHTTPRVLRTIASLAAGDARTALGLLELGTPSLGMRLPIRLY